MEASLLVKTENVDSELATRLRELGIFPGTRLQLIQKGPFGGPFLFRNLDNATLILLGRDVTEQILSM